MNELTPLSRNDERLAELLDRLSKAATPGAWNPAPKRLEIPLSNGQVAAGPVMSWMVGDKDSVEGMTVSLGSERIADHQFVAALVNAFRAGELCVVSEKQPFPKALRGEWTPGRCLHLTGVIKIDALCKYLNEAQK